jgi:hypothetical protein
MKKKPTPKAPGPGDPGWVSYKWDMKVTAPPARMDTEKRIYVVVAATVDGHKGGNFFKVIQPIGRQVAQCAHVVSKMRWTEAAGCTAKDAPFISITTIILQARDSRELNHVEDLLKKAEVAVTSFFDTNPEYGTGTFDPLVSCKTAICTEPIEKFRTTGILDYLPLWGSQ